MRSWLRPGKREQSNNRIGRTLVVLVNVVVVSKRKVKFNHENCDMSSIIFYKEVQCNLICLSSYK